MFTCAAQSLGTPEIMTQTTSKLELASTPNGITGPCVTNLAGLEGFQRLKATLAEVKKSA